MPAEQDIIDTLDEIGKALRERGISLADLIESGREIRGAMIKERVGDLRRS